MNIFVSGQIGDVEFVRQTQQAFVENGHTITYDWTSNETGSKLLAGDDAKLAHIEETSRRADLDLQGVLDSDIFVLCTSSEKPGKGLYVELGAALGSFALRGTPKIYTLGKRNHMSIFYFHDSVTHTNSVEKILKECDTVEA
jgi:hypothetical protein